jgi:alpha-mannosidase
VVLWDEHTWGADKSVSDPDDPVTIGQWKIKQKYVLDSDSLSGDLLSDALPKGELMPDRFDVCNTNSWTRSDMVVLSAEQSRAGDMVIDQSGSTLPTQRLSTGELAVCLRDVPPMAVRRITVKKGHAKAVGRVSISGDTLRNGLMSVVVDHRSGAITSLVWNRKQFVEAGKGLNEYLYVPGKNPGDAISLTNVRVSVRERGGLLSSLVVAADAPGCRKFSSEARLLSGVNRLDIIDSVDKIAIREPEGLHFAFPFHIESCRIRYDVAGAIVEPEQNQLRGSCKNFFSLNRWVDVSGSEEGVSLISLDAPLIEIGSITAESPWMKSIEPSPRLYSYVMNNYWHTNYKADQEGEVRFRYSIVPHLGFDAAGVSRLSRDLSRPLIVMNARGSAHPPGSLFTLKSKNIIVESVQPVDSGNGWLLYLYNPAGTSQDVNLKWHNPPHVTVNESDASGMRGADITNGLTLGASGTRIVRVTVDRDRTPQKR